MTTQWGFARASIANPAIPTSFSQVIIANEPGSGNGGLIRSPATVTRADGLCGRRGSRRQLADDPDFNAAKQAGTILAPAQAGRTDGTAGVRFGQQVKLANGSSDGSFPLGGKIGAIYLASSGKFIGYVPSESGVAVIDLTTTSGQTGKSLALQPISVMSGWQSSSPPKVAAFKVNYSGADLYLLAGVVGNTVRIATINPSNGLPSEAASVASSGSSRSLAVAAVNGRIFVFSAEGTLRGCGSTSTNPRSSADHSRRSAPRSPATSTASWSAGSQFPAIFANNKLTATTAAIQIYDTKWLTQGGNPRLAYSLPQTAPASCTSTTATKLS